MSISRDDILFDARDFRIRRVLTGSADKCIVTFAPMLDSPDLNRVGFLEGFLRRHGVDAIHVITRTNALYLYPEFPEALRQIAKAVRSYLWVATCGSSMGGYAAIRFAEAIGAERAIAFSPVYSLTSRIVPFEVRWKAEIRRVPAVQQEQRHASTRVQPIVFFDSQNLDRLHFELIKHHYPNTLGVPMPNAGHPAGTMLHEMRLFDKVLVEIIDGNFDAAATAKVIRLHRRSSGQYLFTLARRLALIHLSAKRRLADAAVEAKHDAVYLVYCALLAEMHEEYDQAEACLMGALDILPEAALTVRALAAFRLRHGDCPGALTLARKLCELDPQPMHLRLLALALAKNGCASEARNTLFEVPGAAMARMGLLMADAGLISLQCVDRVISKLARFQSAAGLMGEFERMDEYRWARVRKVYQSMRRTWV